MLEGERVLEVEDRKEQTDKFPECDDQRYDERGTLGGEDKDTSDADVLGDAVTQDVEPHLRYRESSKRHRLCTQVQWS